MKSYKDVLLSRYLLAIIDSKYSAVQRVLGLLFTNTSCSLTNNSCEILTESVFNMVANENSCSVRVLRISNFGMV